MEDSDSADTEPLLCEKHYTDESSTSIDEIVNKNYLNTFMTNHKINPRILRSDIQDDINLKYEYTNHMFIYMKFVKLYYKTVLTYGFFVFLIIMVYLSDSTDFKFPLVVSKSNWVNLFETKYDVQNSEEGNAKAHEYIYEEMLRNLRYMQRAASYLQLKQKSMDKRTSALQRQLKFLSNQQMSSYLNEKQAKEMIDDALSNYDADKLGLRDFALESAGGTIISTPDTVPVVLQKSYMLFKLVEYRVHSDPRLLIQTDIQPGNCFAFEGSQGRVRIKLSNIIYVTAITLEHVPTSLLSDKEMKTAPKELELLGLNRNGDGTSLGKFKFLMRGPSRQTFFISLDKQLVPFQHVELQIHTNYGNSKRTCVYRLRVHGKPISE